MINSRVVSWPFPQTTNDRLDWEGLPGSKQFSLLRTFVNYGRKKSYNIGTDCRTVSQTGKGWDRRNSRQGFEQQNRKGSWRVQGNSKGFAKLHFILSGAFPKSVTVRWCPWVASCLTCTSRLSWKRSNALVYFLGTCVTKKKSFCGSLSVQVQKRGRCLERKLFE